jgi:hypothetical protein
MTRVRDVLRGWRTLVLNISVAVVALLEMIVPILGLPEFMAVLPAGWGPYFLLLLALANAMLRLDTRTPPGQSE